MATPEELLNAAIQAMADLHDSMTPDDREENALVPPAALRKFVDAHARLLYERERMGRGQCNDAQIAEWAERHDLKGSPTDLRCAFDDAATLTPN